MGGWVGVVGGGIMRSGIAEMSTRAGYEVLIREVDDEAAETAQLRLGNSLGRAVRAGKFTEADREAAQSRLSFTTELADLAGCSTCTSSPASVSTTYRASTSVSVGVPPRASLATSVLCDSRTGMCGGRRRAPVPFARGAPGATRGAHPFAPATT
jgi:3-hydroxyacyl-CoA dehydrogenase, NAD binding domain